MYQEHEKSEMLECTAGKALRKWLQYFPSSVLSVDLPCVSPDILRFIIASFRELYLTDLLGSSVLWRPEWHGTYFPVLLGVYNDQWLSVIGRVHRKYPANPQAYMPTGVPAYFLEPTRRTLQRDAWGTNYGLFIIIISFSGMQVECKTSFLLLKTWMYKQI